MSRATTPRSPSTAALRPARRASRFGTYVNGETVTETRLEHGDPIRLGRGGGAEMVFLLDDERGVDRRAGGHRGDRRPAAVAALLEGLRALGSGRVLDEVLALVLDSAIEVTGAERGFIMLANDGERRSSSSSPRRAAA